MGLGPVSRLALRGAGRTAAGSSVADDLLRGVIQFGVEAAIGGAAVGLGKNLADLPGRETRANLLQETLTFPKDLGINNNTYFMSLRFVKYTKRAISDPKTIVNKGVINLPIPNQLNDTTSLNYDQAALGAVLGSFVEASAATSLTGSQQASIAAEGLVAGGLERLLSSVPGGSNILNAVSARSGLAINPFLTVVFKNPSFKTHNFSWKFFPKTSEESDILTRIVQTIKYHMLPGLLTSSGVIFEYPEMVNIKIYPSENNLYQFKPCVVKSLNVNYAPSGGPSFFKNSLAAPTGIELRMELQEIEYFTKIDIQDNIAGIKPPDFFTPLTNLGLDTTLLNLLRPGLGSGIDRIIGQGQ
jgi:hypothetical protein